MANGLLGGLAGMAHSGDYYREMARMQQDALMRQYPPIGGPKKQDSDELLLLLLDPQE